MERTINSKAKEIDRNEQTGEVTVMYLDRISPFLALNGEKLILEKKLTRTSAKYLTEQKWLEKYK